MQTRYYVSCFVVRRAGGSHEFLQLLRAPHKYMGSTWQLVTGAIEPGETAVRAVLRELREETSLTPVEFYQCDVINTFYVAAMDSIFQSPIFCAIVEHDAPVRINDEHTDFRWTPRESMNESLMWPGEQTAFAELCREILDDGPAKPYLHIPLEELLP